MLFQEDVLIFHFLFKSRPLFDFHFLLQPNGSFTCSGPFSGVHITPHAWCL